MSQEIIQKFYDSFQKLDAEGMAACYHEKIVFEDPGFGVLKGKRASNMWRMLCESQQGQDFVLEFSDVRMEGNIGRAHWEAHYNFSKTGRRVHNIIEATFKFEDGLIVDHRDRFNVHKWAGQALDPVGWLMGWSGFFKGKLKAQTKFLLDKWEHKNEE